MKKISYLLIAALFVSFNLYSQKNVVRLFSGENQSINEPNLHTNGNMLYMQANNKIFLYNTSNNTKKVINFPSGDFVVSSHKKRMYNYQNMTYAITIVKSNGENGMRIYQIDGDEVKNSYLKNNFLPDTIVMTENHLYCAGIIDNQSVIIPFDLKTKEFKDGSERTYRKIHAVGDSLFIVQGTTSGDVIGLNADGDTWTILEDLSIKPLTENYNGYLYFSTRQDGVYKTNGKKGNISLVMKYLDTWRFTRLKAFDHGISAYYKDGIDFIAKGDSVALGIGIDSLFYGEPFMLDDNRLVVSQNDRFHILETDQKNITEKIIGESANVRVMTSNRKDNEIYAAISSMDQGSSVQNIYGLDSEENLEIYNSIPISTDTVGKITTIDQIDGNIFFITKKESKFILHALLLNSGGSGTGKNNIGLMPLDVYPNPTNSTFTIELKEEDEATIELYGVNGALLVQKTLVDSKNQLDVSSFPNGLYLLRVRQNGKSYQVKVGKY